MGKTTEPKTTLRQIPPGTGRWHWTVFKTIRDSRTGEGHPFTTAKGETSKGVFRRGGHRAKKDDALAEIADAKREFYRQFENPTVWQPARDTVAEWAEHMLTVVWPGLDKAETTLDAYRLGIKNHINGFPECRPIGDMELSKVTALDVDLWVRALVRDPKRGVNVAKNTLTILKSMFKSAVSADRIKINPAAGITAKAPKTTGSKDQDPRGPIEDGKMRLSKAQQASLIEASKGDCMELPILLGLRAGLRFGECEGLTWDDIDFKAKKIHVRQQRQYVRGKGKNFTPLKSEHGRRSIPMTADLIAALAEAKLQASGDLVCTRNGKPFPAKKHPLYFARVAKAAGFRPVEEGGEGMPTHHDLRTSFLSELKQRGASDEACRQLAGHGSVLTTQKHYIRVTNEDLAVAIALIG